MAKQDSYNSSIKCSVLECSHHLTNKDYCTLNSIEVGTHEFYPIKQEGTDCQSFKLKPELAQGESNGQQKNKQS